MCLYGIDFAAEISIGMKTFMKTSNNRISIHAVLLAIYGYDREKFQCDVQNCTFRKPKEFLQFLDIDEDLMLETFIILGALRIIYNIAYYTAMRIRCRI